MTEKVLHIKNMVCPRCLSAVKKTLQDLEIPYRKVELGQVYLSEPVMPETLEKFKTNILTLGFELLEPGRSAIISKIKTLIIQQIHFSKDPLTVNFSTFLSEKLPHEYSYLSRLFSSVEGITIEKYITQQRIEKVKELLFYDEMNLSEIAFQMGYSSVAYLSTQFKKETGMTPSQFKTNHDNNRQTIGE